MDWKFYLEKLWYKILYLAGTIIYLMQLNKLNKELLLFNSGDYFKMVAYDDYAALKFFVGALIFLFLGGVILYIEFKIWKEGYDSVKEMVIAAASILVVIILLIAIIQFITIPILKAIFICAMTIVGFGAAIIS